MFCLPGIPGGICCFAGATRIRQVSFPGVRVPTASMPRREDGTLACFLQALQGSKCAAAAAVSSLHMDAVAPCATLQAFSYCCMHCLLHCTACRRPVGISPAGWDQKKNCMRDHRLVVELKRDMIVRGTLESVDAGMGLTLTDVVFENIEVSCGSASRIRVAAVEEVKQLLNARLLTR